MNAQFNGWSLNCFTEPWTIEQVQNKDKLEMEGDKLNQRRLKQKAIKLY